MKLAILSLSIALFLLAILSLALIFAHDEYPSGRINYNGQQVLRCKFDPAPMQQIWDSLDVWGVVEDGEIDIRVKDSTERALLESLLDGCKVLIEDLEIVVAKADAENMAARAKADPKWWESYHTLAELNQFYRDMVTATGSYVTSQSLGTTVNGNSINVYTINPAKLTEGPVIFLDAGIHAREWVAPSTLNYIVDRLITEYNAGNTQIRTLLNRTRIVFNPVVNPDGYVYSWTTDRLWRKNRARYGTSTCYGVDCNRNFNSHWGQGGSSNQPCSDTYMGPNPASEREVNATQQFILGLQRNNSYLLAYMSYHSYSQLVLRPWGWTSANAPNETYLKTLGDAIQSNISAVHGRTYRSQKSNALYITTGSSSDWLYDDAATAGNVYRNVKYRCASYTIELRPQENNNAVGFQLPPAEILPTGQENYPALVNWLTRVLNAPVYNNA